MQTSPDGFTLLLILGLFANQVLLKLSYVFLHASSRTGTELGTSDQPNALDTETSLLPLQQDCNHEFRL